jgi:hypothetical protein
MSRGVGASTKSLCEAGRWLQSCRNSLLTPSSRTAARCTSCMSGFSDAFYRTMTVFYRGIGDGSADGDGNVALADGAAAAGHGADPARSDADGDAAALSLPGADGGDTAATSSPWGPLGPCRLLERSVAKKIYRTGERALTAVCRFECAAAAPPMA